MNRRNFLSLFAIPFIPFKKQTQLVLPYNIQFDESLIRPRRPLTDIYISPECLDDIRKWNVKYVDEVIRKEIYYNGFKYEKENC